MQASDGTWGGYRRLAHLAMAALASASGGVLAKTTFEDDSRPTADVAPATPAPAHRYRGVIGPEATPEPQPAAPEQWDRVLPFFAQRVIDKGYTLPNPYFIGYSYYDGHQRYQLSGLQVSTGGNPLRAADFIMFDPSRLHTASNQVQLGGWLFPFMNVYGIFGNLEGSGDINISATSRTDMAKFAGIPVGCGSRRPAADCGNAVRLASRHASYNGYTYGGGFTLVGTYKQLFFSLPVTYTVSDISMSDTAVKALNVSPRLGWNLRLGHGLGVLTPFVGATYYRTRATVTGHFDLQSPITGQPTRLNYNIDQQVTGNWSGTVGAVWAINRHLGATLEIGYGYNRSNVIATGFLRF